jgi:hypothetical protein
MKNILRASFLVLGAIGLSSVASATVVTATITGLDPACNCLVVGDKVFDNIIVQGFDGEVNVSGLEDNGVENILFGAGFAVNNGASADFQIFYHVTALAGLITSIDQSFNLTAAGNGGIIAIGETVFSDSAFTFAVAQSSVSYIFGVTDANDPPGELLQGDQLNVPNLSQVWVTKDVNLQSVAGGFVAATILKQSFHQTAVPEPMTLSLMGVGLLGLGLLRRRMR